MEKHVARWSYLLCMVCFLVAVLWRGFTFLGLGAQQTVIPGQTVYYMSFYKAGVLFALVAIATASYAQMMKQE